MCIRDRCSPHNPVGRVWTKEELEAVGEFCIKHEPVSYTHLDVYKRQAESRVREAEKLGFTSCIMPKANVESLQGKYEIKLIGVANIKEAMNCI